MSNENIYQFAINKHNLRKDILWDNGVRHCLEPGLLQNAKT